jgi:WD40 repeat protein
VRARVLVVLSAMALAGASCGGGGSTTNSVPTLPSETLLLSTPSGPVSVQAPAGHVVLSGAGAIASPDGSVVVSTSTEGGSTIVSAEDPTTGQIITKTDVPGHFEVRAVSPGASQVVLMDPVPASSDPWAPVPRERTRIVVADPFGHLEPRTYDLAGNFEPDAFSSDGNELFLLEYFPADAPALYQVTQLDLSHGRVGPVFGPTKAPTERMPGIRLAQVRAPFGTSLYTLYTSEAPGFAPHGLPVARNAEVSFVHVLDLAEGFAHCVTLPKLFWHRPGSAEAMALSPDGGHLFVVDSGLGAVTVFDTSTFETQTTTRYGDPVAGVTRTSAAVSADGTMLFVGAGRSIVEIDTGSFAVAKRITTDGDVTGIGLSSKGDRIYAAVGGELEVFDPSTGSRLGAVPVPTPSPVLQVTALAA